MICKGHHHNCYVNQQKHNVQTHEQGGSAVLLSANKL